MSFYRKGHGGCPAPQCPQYQNFSLVYASSGDSLQLSQDGSQQSPAPCPWKPLSVPPEHWPQPVSTEVCEDFWRMDTRPLCTFLEKLRGMKRSGHLSTIFLQSVWGEWRLTSVVFLTTCAQVEVVGDTVDLHLLKSCREKLGYHLFSKV